jgi:uncharacterized peroxidase-related enzyme
MSRFTQVKHADNPELEAAYGQALEMGQKGEEDGVPSNWVTSQSARPDLLQANLNYAASVFGRGQLPLTVKQLLLMTIAIQNDCKYCSVAHTSALEKMGVPRDVIESCASDPEMASVPAPQRAILRFGLKVARDGRSVTSEDIEALRDHNLSDGEIIEIAMVVGLGQILDMWAEVSGVEVDRQVSRT